MKEQAKRKIRVLVVDDSALVRNVIKEGLNQDPNLKVVGTASDPFIARDQIVALNPDVMTLDVEMPRMDGIEFLRHLMPQHPMPVIIVSSLTERGGEVTLAALNSGALDFITKPKANVAGGLPVMLGELREKIKIASQANLSGWKKAKTPTAPAQNYKADLAQTTDKVICIGASTGGTQAIREVLTQMPVNMPGIVVVQHMPPGFTKQFADQVNQYCQIQVKEAEQGDRILPGIALIAPGDLHMSIRRIGGEYRVEIQEGEKVCGHRPSVEVLFRSAAKFVGRNGIGVMLTGMGHDGAAGMLSMRQVGSRTLAQDEKSSVVYGMPKVAFENGGAEVQVNLKDIPATLLKLAAGLNQARA